MWELLALRWPCGGWALVLFSGQRLGVPVKHPQGAPGPCGPLGITVWSTACRSLVDRGCFHSEFGGAESGRTLCLPRLGTVLPVDRLEPVRPSVDLSSPLLYPLPESWGLPGAPSIVQGPVGRGTSFFHPVRGCW